MIGKKAKVIDGFKRDGQARGVHLDENFDKKEAESLGFNVVSTIFE